MAVYKRGETWWFKFTFGGAMIRESSRSTSKTLALNMERKRRLELIAGASGIQAAKPKLFSAAAAEWLPTQAPNWRPKTLRIAELNVAKLAAVFGKRLTADISAADVAAYQAARRAAGASAKTVNMEVGTLRSVLRRNRRWAAIADDVRMLPEDHAGKGRKLTPAEQSALLAACGASRQPALLPFVVLALETGARYNSLRVLRWEQVDLERRTLRIGDDKTEAGRGRLLPLTAAACAALAHWAAQFPARQAEDCAFPAGRIGGQGRTGPQGSRHAAAFSAAGVAYECNPAAPITTLKTAFQAAKKRAGIRCRFHDLRHTAASRLLDAGVALPKVGKLLGWKPSTLALMAARYGHFTEAELRQAVEFAAGDFQPEWAQNRAQSGAAAGVERAN